jgi:hypothetical protein
MHHRRQVGSAEPHNGEKEVGAASDVSAAPPAGGAVENLQFACSGSESFVAGRFLPLDVCALHIQRFVAFPAVLRHRTLKNVK